MLKKVAVLAVLLGVAFAVMMLTTREKTFEVENSLTVAHPPAEVWAVLAAVELWPAWWPGVERAAIAPALQPGASLDLILKGTPEKAPATVDTALPGRELAWVRGGVLDSLTRTSLKLEPVSGGTRVYLASHVRGPQAFMAGFTGREAFSNYHEAVLASLQRYLER